ncbi:uncharacterized protein LOC111378368 isoform X1 [Olea europaea subsp. europaea]|uniref:Uncharacterized protein LOC111378368 isoform X1 n=1 Tax=Olea europaea subsp. europaea TaxID=158383 RepID=A0A8S0SWC6_OLEEU|nr:uncharacterized protein LOC111378368 isoform X1 [Olea europaea subsp. europaea]
MAEYRVEIQVDDSRSPQDKTPLLETSGETHDSNRKENQENDDETRLDKTLAKLDSFLTFLGFNQTSVSSFVLSWGFLLLIGITLPVVILELSNCPGCEKGQIKTFEIDIVISQACLAAASLICLSHNLRKYGIRKFLFVDRYSGHVERFSDHYMQKISDSMRLLVFWVLPCFILKIAREIIRILYVRHESWWLSVAILFALIFSWTYVTTIFLSACILFHVVCNLQIIHFEEYGKLLERESDCLLLIQEHARLRFYLSKISHRFRIYLLLLFSIVTISQVVTLFQTTVYNGMITLINGGDFAVSAIVQVVGTILCLNAAAKISHRAQAVGSLASRWHALMTCSADSSQLRTSNSTGNLDAASNSGSYYMNYSESDLDSLDFIYGPTNTQLASYMSSYHKRLALGMQANYCCFIQNKMLS